MAGRGHTVEVVTTCARSHVDWADAYEPGRSALNGVVLHRFRVTEQRDYPRFDEANARMNAGHGPRPLPEQRAWMRLQGPYVTELPPWLWRNAGRFDCVICVTYLYWTTWAALETVPGLAPVLLHPLIHEEPVLRLSIFDGMFRAPDAFALAAPEEAQLIRRRFGFDPPGDIIGIGVDLAAGDAATFRARAALDDSPYLLCIGRVQAAKGAGELLDFFVTYKDRHPRDPLKLVLLGEPLLSVPERDDIVVTGFVETAVRDDAIAGALAVVVPSFFESFSMALTEAFAQGRPALVQGRCGVLRGQARRSGGAIPYEGFAEFECALDMLRADDALRDAMGAAGRAFVARDYTWDAVLDRYERLVDQTIARPR
jgi:glycosyltransferase involved in cell wall biosynthesis